MLKIFRKADDILSEYGFTKEEENNHLVEYRRWNEQFKYAHYIDINYRDPGIVNVISYDGSSTRSTAVNLTQSEIKAVLKKIKEKKWNKVKEVRKMKC